MGKEGAFHPCALRWNKHDKTEKGQKGLFGFRRQLDSEEERRSGAKRVEMIHGAFAHLFRGRAPFNIYMTKAAAALYMCHDQHALRGILADGRDSRRNAHLHVSDY